ncbi:hypothetical protein FPV67DRAFT_1468118 [Lyophyllum atratum]|nr:hypothetical protein FPV67DRAFT_1468118 [Lyophyllum atratum]
MTDPSSSSGHRDARRRSRTSRPYPDHSKGEGSSIQGSSTRSKSERTPRSRRAKSASMAPPPSAEDEITHSPWLEILPKGKKYDGAEQRLHYEILAYLNYMEQTPREKKAREAVMAGIRRMVHGRFRNAEVNVFGSSATGLTLPTSDIDVAITIPHIQDVKQALFQLSAKLKNSGLMSNAFVNHRAHVPIINLTTREEYGSISVDIGINNSLGTEGIEVMKGYLSRMPALRPLVLLMKGFLRQRKMNDASKAGLGSYALACMCIHFLQLNPGKRPQDFINKPMETESLGFLLTDFMFYYGFEFPHATSYISVAEGKVLPKPEPSESLDIRCLINPENSISKSINKAETFLRVFKEAYATILQLNLIDEDMLGQLVGVNKKFLAQRALISRTDEVVRQAHIPPRPPHAHYPLPHPLPQRPPPPSSGNTPRAPRTWKSNPGPGAGAGAGPSRPHTHALPPNPMGLRS